MIDIRELVWFGAESAMWAIYAFPIFSLRKFISQSIFMSKIRNCFVFDSILIGMMRFDWPSLKVSFCQAFMYTQVVVNPFCTFLYAPEYWNYIVGI